MKRTFFALITGMISVIAFFVIPLADADGITKKANVTFNQRCRADIVQELRRVPPTRRVCAHVVVELQ
jgi:hypothetical protein